jgi:hypothetical protein
MAHGEDDIWVQLATRIPKTLHRDLKLHCVTHDNSVMGFVTEAIREKLARPSASSAKVAKSYRRTRR